MMLRTQETLDGEIIVDSFAGGGGASTGIELALGRIVNVAINHDPAAIRMHEANHPYTEHYQASVWDVDPETVCRGRPVALGEDDLLLLSIGGAPYYIADIGLRMLSPRELYNAMGFPPDYIIDHDAAGKPYPKTQQVARCGNAVCPPMAAAVVAANLPEYAVPGKIETMAALADAVAM